MKALFWFGILCTWLDSACLQLLQKPNCGRCVQELCPPSSPCDDVLKLDDCNCCSTCANLLGTGIVTSSSKRHKQSSEDDADQAMHAEKSADFQKLQGNAMSPNLQNSNIPSFSLEMLSSLPQSDQTPLSRERGRGPDGNTDIPPVDWTSTSDVLHKTIIKVTKQLLTDEIKNCSENLSEQTCQATMELGNITINSLLGDTKSHSTVTADNTEMLLANDHFITVGTASFLEDESTADISRAKRAFKQTEKIIGVVEIHQILKDSSIILQMLTNRAPQQVIHCALSQTSILGSHIFADIVKTIMEAIHELATYISERTSVVENPTWNSLKQIIKESIDKGFAKASTSITKLANEVKEFLSYNPTLTELGSDEKLSDKPMQKREVPVTNIKTYLEAISILYEESTTKVMRHRVKSSIMELVISGSKVFAEIVDAIMDITNAVSKSVLESAFIKEKPTLQNLLEALKNSIFIGITKSFKVAPKVIHVIIETTEKNGFIHIDDTSDNYLSPINRHSTEPPITVEITKVRPIMNAYLQFICDNSRHYKFNLWGEQLAVPSLNLMPSISEFLLEVDTHIMETLMHLENIVCTSKVLKETDSWINLLQAGNLVNKVVFKRMALFQSKHNFNLNKLDLLLKHMGCSNAIKSTLFDKDSLGNKTLVEMVQTVFKCISNQLKMKTDEMISHYKKLSIKLCELPGGNVINIITEIVIQVVNEMSRKMNESPFITETPTWFNFWFSVIDSMTAGTTKAVDTFIGLIDSIKLLNQNEYRRKEALSAGMSHERFKRGSPNKVSSQDAGKRNVLKQNSLESSYNYVLRPSSAAEVPSKSSNLKSLVDDHTFLTLRKSESVHTREAPGILNTNFNSAKLPFSFSKKKHSNFINRTKREIEFSMKRVKAVQILHEVLKDGSVILQMLTNRAPQEVIHCALNQLPIPGSYILADTVMTIMEAIHESVVYISRSKSVTENPTWDSLMQGIIEAIEKGFAKALTSVSKIVAGVKQFLSFNPTLIELSSDEKVKDGPTHAIEKTLENLKTHLSSISHLLGAITSTKMQQRVNSEITKLKISGSKIFARLAEVIMNITNAISKTILESAFIKEEPSLKNLLEVAKNSIIIGVTKGFKVAPEIIHIVIQEIERSSFIHKNNSHKIDPSSINGRNLEQITTLKVRPIMNAYLQLICDNFRYPKSTQRNKQLMAPSKLIMFSAFKFFTEVNTHIMEILTDIENIVCTKKVLEETDSWKQLFQASNLVNNTVFEKLALFQSKYYFNSTDLNQLLNHIGCNGAIKGILSDKDYVGNKTYVEIIQIALKYISNEIKMKTDEMTGSIQKLSIKLAELPGGNAINIITEIAIQAVNEMARKMSESAFVTESPTWFNFWFSLIDVVTGGGIKVADAYAELTESTKYNMKSDSSKENEKTSKTDWLH